MIKSNSSWNEWTAAVSCDAPWCSSLLLKDLLKAPTVRCRGLEGFSMIDIILANIIPPYGVESTVQAEPALLTSLLSHKKFLTVSCTHRRTSSFIYFPLQLFHSLLSCSLSPDLKTLFFSFSRASHSGVTQGLWLGKPRPFPAGTVLSKQLFRIVCDAWCQVVDGKFTQRIPVCGVCGSPSAILVSDQLLPFFCWVPVNRRYVGDR